MSAQKHASQVTVAPEAPQRALVMVAPERAEVALSARKHAPQRASVAPGRPEVSARNCASVTIARARRWLA